MHQQQVDRPRGEAEAPPRPDDRVPDLDPTGVIRRSLEPGHADQLAAADHLPARKFWLVGVLGQQRALPFAKGGAIEFGGH